MTKESKKLLNEFDKAAGTFCLMKNEGWGKLIVKASIDYDKAKRNLIKRIEYIEKKTKRS